MKGNENGTWSFEQRMRDQQKHPSAFFSAAFKVHISSISYPQISSPDEVSHE